MKLHETPIVPGAVSIFEVVQGGEVVRYIRFARHLRSVLHEINNSNAALLIHNIEAAANNTEGHIITFRDYVTGVISELTVEREDENICLKLSYVSTELEETIEALITKKSAKSLVLKLRTIFGIVD